MIRHHLLAFRSGMIALTLLAAIPVAAARAACPAEGTQDTHWAGIGQLRGGKGYVETPMGEAHYRLTGPGDGPVIILLHQTPWSMIQYGEIQACLAERGVRSLAIDSLHANNQRAATLNPVIHYTLFSDAGSHAMMADPAR